ncbi:MAG: low molecular weight phosphatase family protein, partial [Ilumatobacteraceae bacterium]
ARSQIAAAIWRSVTGENVASAGTEPALKLHPLTIKIAEQHRLNLSNARPRDLESLKMKGKTVITVCDQSHDDLANPLSRLHWSMPDPAELGTMAAFEKTFQELVERIQPLVK